MKYLLNFAFLFMLSLALFSCGDDDGSTDPADLEGTWSSESFTSTVESSFGVAGQSVDVDSDIRGENMNLTVVMADGNFTTSGSYDLVAVFTTGGIAQPEQTTPSGPISGSGTYTVVGDQITFSNALYETPTGSTGGEISSEPSTATFSISGGTLTLDQDETINQDFFGEPLVANVTSKSVFSRQ